MRSFFLVSSQSRWLRERAQRYRFVRRAVSRFMPGETAKEALAAACTLRSSSIGTVFTYLGENITDASEAERVTTDYLGVLGHIQNQGLGTELSVKLTQLGLDLDKELCYANRVKIIQHAGEKSVVWIDMEASNYVDVTLELYCRARQAYPNVGVCLQAYLYRTAADLASLIPLGPAIRLVKGAYKEPPDRAFPKKKGENITDASEAERVTTDYLGVLGHIQNQGLGTELSVKLTQLGLDLDKELCYANLVKIIQHAGEKSVVWIDMEASNYVDVTLEVYCRARQAYPNVGVCLQAYLYRTAADLASLIPLGPAGSKTPDRKSTRLNSSHGYISYAVFCLKKKKNNISNS